MGYYLLIWVEGWHGESIWSDVDLGLGFCVSDITFMDLFLYCSLLFPYANGATFFFVCVPTHPPLLAISQCLKDPERVYLQGLALPL